MKIYAICLVKNEVDVLARCLNSATAWAEKVIVYDNGSTDGTWELAQQLAQENPTIIAWKQDDKAFYEGLRGEAFDAFRHLAKEGDWWCFRLDADEFYPENPREQLQATPVKYHVVAKKSIQYFVTHEDIAEYDFTRLIPVNFDNIRYYHPKTYTEVRFFRHRQRLKWEPGRDMPRHMGIVSPHMIKVQHFQFRSIPQMMERIETRAAARKQGFYNWDFADNSDWRQLLLSRAETVYDNRDGAWQIHDPGPKRMHDLHKYIVKRLLHMLRILP